VERNVTNIVILILIKRISSVPATIFYYSGYEYLRDNIRQNSDLNAPIIAGTLARTMAVGIVSPIELLRTKAMSDTKSLSSVFMEIIETVKMQGVFTLWRGVTPTLIRDVPFSGIYWYSYDNIYTIIQSKTKAEDHSEILFVNFTAGTVSGLVNIIIYAVCSFAYAPI
jgi:solute carrier family 25, member 39/40